MRDYSDLRTRLESDPELRTLVESEGLRLTTAFLYLQLRSLEAVRGFDLTTDVDARDYEVHVQKHFISLTGEAVIEGDRHGTDRLGVWDGAEGAHLDTSVDVRFYEKPDERRWSPLAQTARLAFKSDPPVPGLPWTLRIPLPRAELRALYDAVEDGSASEVRIHADIEDLFERARECEPPVREPTDYFALPRSLITRKKIPGHTFPSVNEMPCGQVRVSLHGRTLRSLEIARREEEERKANREWGSEPRPLEERQVSAIKTVRDSLHLLAAALLLIFLALLF